MEKKGDDVHEEDKYHLVKDVMFCETMEDGVLAFKNIVPAKRELKMDVLKKLNEPELTEASIMKAFKVISSHVFNKGNLVYNSKDKKFYKVVDLKTDDAYNPTFASLVIKDGDDKLELSKESDFEHFRNYIELKLIIKSSKSDNMMLAIKQKLYDKFQDTLSSIFNGVDLSLIAFKLFFNSKELDKALCVAQMNDMTEGDYIYA